jgi:putative nucleotide binding protein
MQKKYEEFGIVLDYLPHGSPFDPRPIHLREPIVQVLGETFFTLLEVIPTKGASFQLLEKISLGKETRDKVDRIRQRIGYDNLTATAKNELPHAIMKAIEENESRFVEFFNKAGPLTTRLHQLELLPGVGKKLMQAIIEEREKAPFKSLAEIGERIKGLDAKSALVKRILMEIQGKDAYFLFVRPWRKTEREGI